MCARHGRERHLADAALLKAHHVAPGAFAHEPGRGVADQRAQHTVAGAGRATTLHVAEHGGAHLALQQRLQLRHQHLGHTAQSHRLGPACLDRLHRELPAARLGTLGHTHHGEALARRTLAAHRGNGFDLVVDLGQQDDVGRRGQARFEREPAGVAAHGLDQHHAAVALAGGLHPVQRFGHGRHGGVEAEAALHVGDVVVDGLGHTHRAQAVAVERIGDGHGAVATDGHQAVEAQLTRIGHDVVAPVAALVGKRAHAVAGADQGATQRANAAHVLPAERAHTPLDQAQRAVFNAQHLGAALVDE